MHRSVLVLIAPALPATGCRATDPGTGSVPPAMAAGMDGKDDTAGMAMTMGDPDATPAEDIPGADLVEGSFVLLDTRPQGYDGLTGTAALARHGGGTTITLRLEGVKPGVDFVSHVHEGLCPDYGADHYRFDPAGSDLPPNEIHLAFTSDADGGGFMTAENDRTVDERAVSVVVHPRDLIDNKIACAEFR